MVGEVQVRILRKPRHPHLKAASTALRWGACVAAIIADGIVPAAWNSWTAGERSGGGFNAPAIRWRTRFLSSTATAWKRR